MFKPVQRWDLGSISIKQENNETGEWVLHDDHLFVVDALRARVAELEAERDGLMRAAEHSEAHYRVIHDLSAQIMDARDIVLQAPDTPISTPVLQALGYAG